MKRSWAWPVLMAIVLPGGLLLAAAWLLARARGASRPWAWPVAASQRWEWPTGSRGVARSAARPDTLH